jgi:hypothetical protein
MNKSIYNELLEHVIETIEDQDLTDFDDLHFHAFNEDYYIIGYKNASDWLDSHGVSPWEAIETVRDYEQDNFGEFNTEVNSESITNMLAYIYGGEVLSDFDLDQDKAELLADLKLAAEG